MSTEPPQTSADSRQTRTEPRQMKLGAFLMATGHHVAAWRHPDVPADAGLDFTHYKHLAQVAEAAKFDTLFIADSVAAATGDAARHMARSDHFEPLTLVSALSAVTERIGLIVTATTSYNEPFHIARKFASLDHLSGGRAGWNLVTSDAAAEAPVPAPAQGANRGAGNSSHVGFALRGLPCSDSATFIPPILWPSCSRCSHFSMNCHRPAFAHARRPPRSCR